MVEQPSEKYYRDGDGRWRSYKCRKCGDWFEVFLGRPLPEDARYCNGCCQKDPIIKKRVATAFERRRLRDEEARA